MIKYQYYPKSNAIPEHLLEVVTVFSEKWNEIKSEEHQYNSNKVLDIVRNGLEDFGYIIEKSKKAEDKIKVPVLFGLNGKLEKYFDADGVNLQTKTVIEVEAGRAVTNYQFLKDLFQACMMSQIEYLVIAVRITYRNNPDFQSVVAFFDTLYASARIQLPLHGILIIGY